MTTRTDSDLTFEQIAVLFSRNRGAIPELAKELNVTPTMIRSVIAGNSVSRRVEARIRSKALTLLKDSICDAREFLDQWRDYAERATAA